MQFDHSLLTGIEDIDRQHQHLLRLLEELEKALAQQITPLEIGSIVKELLGYSIYHFNTEERLLKEYTRTSEESAEADSHIAQHRRFSQHIISLQERLSKRAYVDAEEIRLFLNNWIREHLMDTDKTLARLVLRRRAE